MILSSRLVRVRRKQVTQALCEYVTVGRYQIVCVTASLKELEASPLTSMGMDGTSDVSRTGRACGLRRCGEKRHRARGQDGTRTGVKGKTRGWYLRKVKSQQSLDLVVGDGTQGSGTQEQRDDIISTLGTRRHRADVCQHYVSANLC